MPPPNPGVSAENLKVYWDKKRDSKNTSLLSKLGDQVADQPDLYETNMVVAKGRKLSPSVTNYLKYKDIEININII